jgi:HEPN domain
VTWQPGRDRVAELQVAGELESVAADERLARRLLDDASSHLRTAAAGLAEGDLSGAYQLAYDALRKSAASLLAVQGLRSTSRGGHIAIQDAITAQFGSTVRAFRSFSRIRRARNRFEYPDTDTAGPDRDDVHDAITTATTARDAAITILDQGLLDTWRPADSP